MMKTMMMRTMDSTHRVASAVLSRQAPWQRLIEQGGRGGGCDEMTRKSLAAKFVPCQSSCSLHQ